jgi:hypothetical protein
LSKRNGPPDHAVVGHAGSAPHPDNSSGFMIFTMGKVSLRWALSFPMLWNPLPEAHSCLISQEMLGVLSVRAGTEFCLQLKLFMKMMM